MQLHVAGECGLERKNPYNYLADSFPARRAPKKMARSSAVRIEIAIPMFRDCTAWQ